MKQFLVVTCGILCGMPSILSAADRLDGDAFPPDQYLVFTLSEEQLDEVQQDRRFTLSREQLDRARSVAPTFPKRLGVASPFVEDIPDSRFSLWPDQVTGIWYSRTQVAVPAESWDGVEGCREFSKRLYDGDAVLVGLDGSLWIGSRQVDRNKLIRYLDVMDGKEPAHKEFMIFVLRPPVLEPEEEQVIQQAVNDILGLCAERELDCLVGG